MINTTIIIPLHIPALKIVPIASQPGKVKIIALMTLVKRRVFFMIDFFMLSINICYQ